MPNRLQYEKSPYLLQHANNPVDWYPWCDEAFSIAKKRDVPVFLSIGYSTCHWCHVMERESFENEQVAHLLNENFVSIKVDREEQPEIDSVYMTVCQMATGGGGWPLTIIMTPDTLPFFAGTYFPRTARHNRTGIVEILQKITELWKTQRTDILHSSADLVQSLQKRSQQPTDGKIDESALREAFHRLEENFDEVNGGFGNEPKFPTPHNLLFLLRYYHRSKTGHALYMVEKTMTEMLLGGIHDHVGGGFHRYSTDHLWLLPHFEKMLYDQAMLLYVYTELYSLTRKNIYRECAQGIIFYVKECLLSPEGAFYSAEDADSEGQEGKFYVWTAEEFESVAGTDAPLLTQIFNITEEGNFSDPHGHSPAKTNILHLKKRISDLAVEHSIPKEELTVKISSCLGALHQERAKRCRPLLDKKILADWNGLMIAALAKAGSVLNDPETISLAVNAAAFLLSRMKGGNNTLFHRYIDGEVKYAGNLEDYAFVIWGLLELYGATFDAQYLLDADSLSETTLRLFKDFEAGGFFFTSGDSDAALVRQKELYDGAIPSGNSTMLLNLHFLAHYTGNPRYDFEAAQLLLAFGGLVSKSPLAFTHFLSGLCARLSEPFEIVLAGSATAPAMKRYIREFRGIYAPNAVLLVRDTSHSDEKLTQAAPFTEGMRDIDGELMIYSCQNFSCDLPTASLQDVLNRLESGAV